MAHLSHFLKNNPSHRLRGWLHLTPHLVSLGRWHKLMLSSNGTAVARSFGNSKEAFWPHEEPMCSPPPSLLLFLDGGTKITIEEYHESCQRGCCALLQESVSKCLMFLE